MKYRKVILSNELKVEDVEVRESQLVSVTREGGDEGSVALIDGNSHRIATRSDAEFAGKGLYLSDGFDWILGRDSQNSLVLIPIKR